MELRLAAIFLFFGYFNGAAAIHCFVGWYGDGAANAFQQAAYCESQFCVTILDVRTKMLIANCDLVGTCSIPGIDNHKQFLSNCCDTELCNVLYTDQERKNASTTTTTPHPTIAPIHFDTVKGGEDHLEELSRKFG